VATSYRARLSTRRPPRLVAVSALDYPFGTVDRRSAFVIMAVVFLEPFLVALWIAVGSGRQRRSHFWVRALLAVLALPALMAALDGLSRVRVPSLEAAAEPLLTLLFFVGVIALMFVPGLLYLPSDSSPGPSDSDGGGGPGPGHPRPSPHGPGGGVPLPDADQARARIRDQHRPKLRDLNPRRPAHDPQRAPAASPPSRGTSR
jgi:hypothetical protein